MEFIIERPDRTTLIAKKDIRQIARFIGSRRFFGIIVGFFVLETLWIALSGRYPMAFDEDFHLGIIKLYAHHLSPFWSGHPSGSDAFGAVSRDPSYLYQYLMSFPYRLVSVFTSSQAAHVIVLRLIDIALFAYGLVLYRTLLLKTGASKAVTNFCLAIFVLLPVVPLLAAQINYDNLLMPMIAGVLIMTANFNRELTSYKRINGSLLLGIVSLCLLASLVKYAFLPVFAVVTIFIMVRLWQVYRGTHKFWISLGFGMTLMTKRVRWLLIILLIVSAGLFTQRYVVNLFSYHKPVPACDDVLTVQQCSAYPPWNRDYTLAQTKSDRGGTDSPIVFSMDWFYGMWLRTFFAVDGPGTRFQTRGPLILPGMGAIVFAAISAIATLVAVKRTFKRYNGQVIWLLIATALVYVLALWTDEYRSFIQTGQAVAINGRYLLPIMPLTLIILALGADTALAFKLRAKVIMASIALVCMFWGGGTLTYILRSNNAWYWPGTPLKGANHIIQKTLGPITPGYYHPGEFMGKN